MSKKKRANVLDVQVGHRVRLGRMLAGLSQDRLGELLDLTFQQVQKYEKGINRISASRLLEIAAILRLPIGFFYEGIDCAAPAAAIAEEDRAAPVQDWLAKGEGLRLGMAFMRIKDVKVRRHLAGLVKALTDEDAAHLRPSP